MSNVVLDECIYVKRTKETFGTGNTSRESVLESLWFPLGVDNGYVELFPIMDNLQSVLPFKEKVAQEIFREQYAAMDNSREIYVKLKGKLS